MPGKAARPKTAVRPKGSFVTIEALENRRLLSNSIPVSLQEPPAFHLTVAAAPALPPPKNWAWQAAAPSPLARFEAAAEAVGGRLYVFGGFFNAQVQATTRCDCYNPATNNWTRIADMPEPLTHTGHTVDGNTIWFVGGFVGDERAGVGQSTSHTWKYNVLTNKWSAGPALPVARGAGALVLVGRTLHFFGGLLTRAQDQGEHWTLDIDHGTKWIAAPPLPVPTNHMTGIAVGTKIYAIGGQHLWNDPNNANINTVQIFDTTHNTWSFGAPLPVGLGHIADSTFVMNGQIIVVGGAADGISAENMVLDYDPASNLWRQIATLPQARRAPVARAINGQIIITTGDPGNVSPTAQTWIGTPITSGPWRFGPSLPVALGEVSGAVIGSRMYLIGQGSADTLVYNLQTQTWNSPLAAARRPFVGASQTAVTLNGFLYVIGGIGGGSEGRLQVYNPQFNLWTSGPNLPSPLGTGGLSATVIGGKIYVAGGIIGSGSSSAAACFDPAKRLWTMLPPMPLALNHAAAGTDGHLLYIFGGQSQMGISNGSATVQIYNPATATWTSSTSAGSGIPPMPTARSDAGQAIYWNGEFYLFGGDTLSGPGSIDGAYRRVDIYNPLTRTWRTGSPMPISAGRIFPILYGNNVYIAGGGSQSTGFQSNTMQIYTLSA